MRQIDMEGIGHFVHSNGDETLTIIVRVALAEEINTAYMQTARRWMRRSILLTKASRRSPSRKLTTGRISEEHSADSSRPVLFNRNE